MSNEKDDPTVGMQAVRPPADEDGDSKTVAMPAVSGPVPAQRPAARATPRPMNREASAASTQPQKPAQEAPIPAARTPARTPARGVAPQAARAPASEPPASKVLPAADPTTVDLRASEVLRAAAAARVLTPDEGQKAEVRGVSLEPRTTPSAGKVAPQASFTAAFERIDAAADEDAFFRKISEEDRRLIREHATAKSYNFGQSVVKEGEPADGVYIIVEGRCRVVKKDGRASETALAILQTGELFGEMAKPGEPRSATVRATGAVRALHLDYEALGALLSKRPQLRGWLSATKEERAIITTLRSTPLFSGLSDDQLESLVETLVPVSVKMGQVVFEEGATPGPMFVVKSGRLRLDRAQPQGEPIAVAYPRESQVFGLDSALNQVPREVTVTALVDTLLLALSPRATRTLYDTSTSFRAELDRQLSQIDYQKPAPLPLDIAEMAKLGSTPGRPSAGESEPSAGAATGAPAATPEAPRGPPPGSVLAPTEEEPYASEDGYFKRRTSKIRRFPYVRQVDETDCGVACLAMICRYYGKRIALGRIRQLSGASNDGTSLTGLCRAAQELGLAARTARVSAQNLDRVPFPAIVHWQNYHWIVLVGVYGDRVRVADPAIGDYSMPREEFLKNWNGFAALFDYTDAFETTPEFKASFGWVTDYFRPYIGSILTALALALVVSGLTMMLPVLSQLVVDRVIVDGAKELLATVLITMACVFVFQIISRSLQGYLLAFIAVRVDAAILDYLSRRLLALPMSYFTTRRTGDIQRRLGGARELREMFVRSGVAGILAIVQIVVALALMVMYSPKLTLIFAGMTPLYLGLMALSAKLMRPLFGQLEEAYGKYSSDQLDALKGIESVKAASAEAVFRDNLLDRFLKTSNQQFRADYTALLYEGALQGVGYLSQILFLWVGATLAIEGEITIGGFVAFNSLVGMANQPIFTALGLWDQAQRAQVLFNRLADLFETVPEQGFDRGKLVPVRTLSGGVELRKLGFRYGGPESKPILKNIDLRVEPGEMIALVGRSGSGKTTLVKLLSGLLEPTEGSVLFDGVDHRNLNYRDLRRRIGFVLQENHIFSGTILENIAFGEEPDLERAVAAARAADAHGFISNLPLGYTTHIGETGIKLSGGQAQRVAIARALYKQPQMFIFDEATSALDTESEKTIQNNMSNYFAGRTAFVIAHRLSTIRDADRILVLEKGEIVEVGSHDELMKKRGLYFELVNKQVEQ
ncbi:MAG: ABC transporter transmembrane domain-containing protein [Myxococcota bacterium]